jgi:hypothetical protein
MIDVSQSKVEALIVTLDAIADGDGGNTGMREESAHMASFMMSQNAIPMAFFLVLNRRTNYLIACANRERTYSDEDAVIRPKAEKAE